MQNSMMLFSFFVFEWKYPFWANLVEKFEIVTLCWNLVARLIRTCKIQWWCSFFFVFDWKYRFWSNLIQKIKIISWSLNLVARLIRICWIQWSVHFFPFWPEAPFLDKCGPNCQYLQFFCLRSEMLFFSENLVKNIKVVSLRLKLLVTISCKIYLEFSRFN